MSKGGPKRKVSDGRLIEIVKKHPDPAVSTAEVAEAVGLTSTRANELLGELRERGILESKQFGSGYGWWVIEDPSAR